MDSFYEVMGNILRGVMDNKVESMAVLIVGYLWKSVGPIITTYRKSKYYDITMSIIKTAIIDIQKTEPDFSGMHKEQEVIRTVFLRAEWYLKQLGIDEEYLESLIRKTYEKVKKEYPTLFGYTEQLDSLPEPSDELGEMDPIPATDDGADARTLK